MSGDDIVERILDLTDQLEALAAEMRDGDLTTREQWTAHGLLLSAAAHSRGAAAQLYRPQSQVT